MTRVALESSLPYRYFSKPFVISSRLLFQLTFKRLDYGRIMVKFSLPLDESIFSAFIGNALTFTFCYNYFSYRTELRAVVIGLILILLIANGFGGTKNELELWLITSSLSRGLTGALARIYLPHMLSLAISERTLFL